MAFKKLLAGIVAASLAAIPSTALAGNAAAPLAPSVAQENGEGSALAEDNSLLYIAAGIAAIVAAFLLFDDDGDEDPVSP